MDDLRETLRLLEQTLFELRTEVTTLEHRLWAVGSTLIAISPDLDETQKLLEIAMDIAPNLNPYKAQNESFEAYLEILRARKNPKKPDA